MSVGVGVGVGHGVGVGVGVVAVVSLWEGEIQVPFHLQLVLDDLLHVTVQAALDGGVEVHKVRHVHRATGAAPRHTAVPRTRPAAPCVAAPGATAVRLLLVLLLLLFTMGKGCPEHIWLTGGRRMGSVGGVA